MADATAPDARVTAAPAGKTHRAMTSRELARTIGVSQSMISRAFSSHASIAPAMREQIIAAAAQAGYRPNVVARSLSTRRSNIVGIVMAGMTNPFYPELLERLTRALQEVGLQTLLFHAPPGEDVDGQLPLLMQYQVDAVIIASAPISSGMAQTWLQTGRPAILFNRSVPGTDVTTVACDNVAGGAMVADLFARLGRQRIAFVGGRADTSTNADRARGFSERLRALGLPLHAQATGADYGYEQGFAATLEIADAKPDAIFYANDITALGGMDALRQTLRLRVPEDVAVVGFDDIPMAAWPAYQLTTVRQPVEAMIAASVSYLVAHMKNGTAPEMHVLGGTLIERASTRLVRS